MSFLSGSFSLDIFRRCDVGSMAIKHNYCTLGLRLRFQIIHLVHTNSGNFSLNHVGLMVSLLYIVITHIQIVITHTHIQIVITHIQIVITHIQIVITHIQIVITHIQIEITHIQIVITHIQIVRTHIQIEITDIQIEITHIRMQKTSMKFGQMTSFSGLKPPKPPCWRDFVQQGKKENNPTQLDISDSNKTFGNKLGSRVKVENNRSSSIPRPIKPTKRVRARIHRTRSEHLIHEEDLPETNMATSLANTRPKEFGLRKQFLEDRLNKEENTKRCQSWLQSIEACEPLDEIRYTHTNSKDVEGVVLEIPEETIWDGEGGDLKPPLNTSASSSETELHSWLMKQTGEPYVIDSDENLYRKEILEMTAGVHEQFIKDKSLGVDSGGLE
ncbi:hypothetical protein LOTGIDRAFT_159591 [Lottia gigantea]|uniref:Uncharacterized protein n=1 Tax=Lottia gigantea TaxID=225164 RepID=V4C5I2_LOTGI|nr:hypothetical protein LOTGIDRAFT_159591 [Lottia gigantea]ESO96844.1 hypothetical protein LOTGIDRAFT_159591 [Lottia gigantea]